MRLACLLPSLLAAPQVGPAPPAIPLSVDGPVVLSAGSDAAGLARVAQKAVDALPARAHECLDRPAAHASGVVWLQLDRPTGDAPATITASASSLPTRATLDCLKGALEPLRQDLWFATPPARVVIGVRYGDSADPLPVPPIASGEVTLVGPLTREEIATPIRQAMAELRVCYERELTKHPDLGGKLIVRFRIAADGSVSEATLQSTTLGSPPVEECVVNGFQRLHFPAPRGGGVVLVNYPLVFSPS